MASEATPCAGDSGGSSERRRPMTPSRAAASCYHGVWKYQEEVKNFYSGDRVQIFVAGLICSNFIIQCVQMQIDPLLELHPVPFSISEDFFNIMFTFELLVNMYGKWFFPFIMHAGWGWNIFDVVVVSIGIIDLCRYELYGPLRMFRMVRAFRVFRLFGKLESLKRILTSLRTALPGVMNSFVVILLMMCIYAVLAVEFFKHVYMDCLEDTHDGEYYFGLTPRGHCFGPEYYGNFMLALYTLFQVLTGESWSEACVRPVLKFFKDDPSSTFGVAIYFVSFFIVNATVLLNVVVALLLDGMSRADAAAETPAIADEVPPSAEEEEEDPRKKLASLRAEINEMRAQLTATRTGLKTQLQEILDALQPPRPTLESL